MTSKKLIALTTRHQVLLERLKTHEARNLAGVMDEVDRAIREELAVLDVEKMSDLSRSKLQSLLKELRKQQVKLQQKAVLAFTKRLSTIADYEEEFEGKAFATATGTKLGSLKAGAAYQRALSWPMSATGSTLKPFIQDWSDTQVKAVANAVQKAWGQGWTIPQLQQAIRGTRKAGYKDGLVAASKRQAEAVARTSIQHVSTSSRTALWQEHEDVITGYRFVATLDGKTTTQCRSLDQRVFPLGEGPTPPLHVNCRSTIVPELSEDLDFLDKGATRSSKDGYVDAKLSYYEWLKTQPEAFQNEVLGQTRAQLFRDGGLSAEKFAALNLDRNFEPLTLEEMKAKEPIVFERAGVEL